MSGGTTAMWVLGAAAAAGTVATIDANKSAQHQAKVQREQQAKQLEEATRMETQKLQQAQQLADQSLAAQRSAQAASIAQANKAAGESKALMDKQLKASDENMNRALQKRPNTSRIVDEAAQAGKAGASGTMLTGSQGVDPSALQLGRSTLLGA
jgi:G3E family GTPase